MAGPGHSRCGPTSSTTPRAGLGMRSRWAPMRGPRCRITPPPPTSASSTPSRPAPPPRSPTRPGSSRSRRAPGAVDLTAPAAGYPDSPGPIPALWRRQLRPDRSRRRRRRGRRGRLGVGARRHRGGGDLGWLAVPEPRRGRVQVGRGRPRDPGEPRKAAGQGCGGTGRCGTCRLRARDRPSERLRKHSSDPAAERGARSEAAPRQGLRQPLRPAISPQPRPLRRVWVRGDGAGPAGDPRGGDGRLVLPRQRSPRR